MQKKGQFWSQKIFGCEIMRGSRKRSSYKNVQSPICCSLIKITAQRADKKVLHIYWPWEQERGKVQFENICTSLQRRFFQWVTHIDKRFHSQALFGLAFRQVGNFCSGFSLGHRSVLRKHITARAAEGRTSRKSKAGGQMGSNSLPPPKRGIGIEKKRYKNFIPSLTRDA